LELKTRAARLRSGAITISGRTGPDYVMLRPAFEAMRASAEGSTARKIDDT
jgi:spore coat polysaccharide biosynthesis predicted glycosyltransferase SpsG